MVLPGLRTRTQTPERRQKPATLAALPEETEPRQGKGWVREATLDISL